MCITVWTPGEPYWLNDLNYQGKDRKFLFSRAIHVVFHLELSATFVSEYLSFRPRQVNTRVTPTEATDVASSKSQVAKRLTLVYYIITCSKRFNVKPSHLAKWQEDKIGAKLLTRKSILAVSLFLLSFL